ncbi:MAG: hypothetical protein Q4D94_05415, partial [Bacillota bacterium]|nr:hypothetical protein [Bacillota bacterium]
VDYQSQAFKHYMISPSLEQVKRYLKLLNGEKSLVFVDDCLRDTEAMMKLLESRNVQVVGFERDFNYEGQYHRLRNYQFELKEITVIDKEDAQGIIDSIPNNIKREGQAPKDLTRIQQF